MYYMDLLYSNEKKMGVRKKVEFPPEEEESGIEESSEGEEYEEEGSQGGE